jgi:hypothetical protein
MPFLSAIDLWRMKGAKLVSLNLEGSGLRPQTVRDFVPPGQRLGTKDRKMAQKEVLKQLRVPEFQS